MKLSDLLEVLREEFERAAIDIDEQLGNWLGDDPAQAPLHCEALVDQLNRLIGTLRLVNLQGLAQVLEQLRDAAQLLALSDEASMAEQLPWLMLWRDPVAYALHHPAEAESTQIVLDFLAAGPLPPSEDLIAELRQQLMTAPQLEPDANDALRFAPPQAGDVSLALPDALDQGLFEAFLADAPRQLARLAETVATLTRAVVPSAELEEAQRLAHTFKGSGNIIGVRGIGQMAHRIEDLLDYAQQQGGGALPAPMAHDLQQATAALDQMVYALRGEEQAPAQALALLTRLVDWGRAIDEDRLETVLAERAARGADAAAAPPDPNAVAASGAEIAAPATDAPAVDAPAIGAPVAATTAPPPPVALDLDLDLQAAAAPPPAATPLLRVMAPAAVPEEPDSEIRVPSRRLAGLVRQAGQSLMLHSRQSERLHQVEQRLAAAQASQSELAQRLRLLELHIERQGVGLQERVGAADFDPLEMDRYDELHTLARFVAELAADSQELTRQAHDENRELLAAATEQDRQLRRSHRELLGTRLLPFRHISARLRRNVVQTAAATGKRAQLLLEGEAVMLDSDVLERLTEPLLHLLRNAVDHGLESGDERELLGKPAEGRISLSVRSDGPMVQIECADDGRGLDLEAIEHKARALGLLSADARPGADAMARLILLPGFSTRDSVSEISGRGVGLDVVAQRLRALKGELDIRSEPLRGSCFVLRLPASLGSGQALIVEAGGERFALPAEGVRFGVAASQGERGEGVFELDGQRWPCDALATRLGLPEPADADHRPRPVVVLRSGRDERALRVDRVVETRELILQEPGRLLRRLPLLAGSALRADGRVIFLLDPHTLVAAELPLAAGGLARLRQRQQTARRRLLVVDDSLSVRKGLVQLLGDAGYAVQAARDGFEALQLQQQAPAELVLTDLEMPNLNGLELTRALRADPRWQQLPVLMLTSRASDKHRASAEQAGVDRYLTKPYTDDELLTEVRALLR